MKTADVWKQRTSLTTTGTVASDNFGSSVGISGATAVIGAWGHSKNAGRAYVFENTSSFGCGPKGVVITGSGPPNEPTGLATFGDVPSLMCPGLPALPVSTSEILGYVSFSTLAVSSVRSDGVPVQGDQGLSVQLNTVLQVQSKGTSYYYLIQNGPGVNPTNTPLHFGSDVFGWGTNTQKDWALVGCAQTTRARLRRLNFERPGHEVALGPFLPYIA
jgi:hypothetical protein